jgi:pimeloyl-ACP methyl ester carboxylesterase
MFRAIQSVSLRRPDLTPLLADISAPALICAAADDPYWTPADAAAAASHLPNGTPVILPVPVTSPRCSKRHPPWRTCSSPSGPTLRR